MAYGCHLHTNKHGASATPNMYHSRVFFHRLVLFWEIPVTFSFKRRADSSPSFSMKSRGVQSEKGLVQKTRWWVLEPQAARGAVGNLYRSVEPVCWPPYRWCPMSQRASHSLEVGWISTVWYSQPNGVVTSQKAANHTQQRCVSPAFSCLATS